MNSFIPNTSFQSHKIQHVPSVNRRWSGHTRTRVLKEVNLDVEKNEAFETVQQLLEKQKAELQETELLLKRLTTVTMPRNGTDHREIHDEWISSKSPELASSILSGVKYGFVSRSEGALFDDMSGGAIGGSDEYAPPPNILLLASKAFRNNFDAIFGKYRDEVPVKLTKQQKDLQAKLKMLTLNCTAVWEREREMTQIEAPLAIEIPYYFLCYFLDYAFEGRYVPARFYFLETVARMPYFSYISMLQLYETLGWWRRSVDAKRIHFAEEWNEFNHLLIMESLGGDQEWWVRFSAYHAAVTYYMALIVLWCISPTAGYKFSEMLETHAVNTYSQLLDDNEELLKSLPATRAAVNYYSFNSKDPLFTEYQTAAMTAGEEPRQPGNSMKSMYDVFSAIRDDEGDHVQTMEACLDPNVAVKSPSVEKAALASVALVSAFGYFLSTGDLSGLDLNSVDLGDTLSNIDVGDSMSGVEGLLESEVDGETVLMTGAAAGGLGTVIKELVRGNFGILPGFDNAFDGVQEGEKLASALDAESANQAGGAIADLLEMVLKLFGI